MNTLLETMPSPTQEPLYVRTILNEHRMKAAIIHLEAGEEIELPLEPTAQEHLLVVMQGRVTVRFDELNHVLNQEQALHLSRHDPVGVWNHGETPAKLLRVDIQLPPPEPLIVSMPPA
jgi:redox-sensitive bicupin YhaK (pirin superfamily)